MSILLQQAKKMNGKGGSRSKQDYFGVVHFHSAENTKQSIKMQLYALGRFCLEHYSMWGPNKWNLVDEENVISDFLEIKKTLTIEAFEDLVCEFYQKFVNWRSKSVNTLSLYYVAFPKVREYMEYRGVKIDRSVLNKRLKLPMVEIEERHSVTLEELHAIYRRAESPHRTFYLVLVSTGMRPIEVTKLRKKDFRLVSGHYFVFVESKSAKKRKTREVIMSIEATNVVKPILDKIKAEDFPFNPDLTLPKNRVRTFSKQFGRLRKRANLDEKHRSSWQAKVTMYRLRGFFEKMAERACGSDYAHRMLGHDGYMLQYGTLTDKEKLRYYLKFEKYVTMFDLDKVKAVLAEENFELYNEVDDLKNKVAKLLQKERRE